MLGSEPEAAGPGGNPGSELFLHLALPSRLSYGYNSVDSELMIARDIVAPGKEPLGVFSKAGVSGTAPKYCNSPSHYPKAGLRARETSFHARPPTHIQTAVGQGPNFLDQHIWLQARQYGGW